MKVDLSVPIKDINGELIKEKDEPVQIKKICVNALMANYKNEKNLEGTEKLERYELAKKINQADKEIDLTVEELAKIKKLVGRFGSTLAVGQVYKLLDGVK